MLRSPRVYADAPFFAAAFWSQVAISTTLLLAFIVISVMLLKLKRGAAIAHTCFVVVLFGYLIVPGGLWLLPNGVGDSVARATGIANMGTGLLLFFPVPFLYLLISTACVNIARYRIKVTFKATAGPSTPFRVASGRSG